jgi:hypothetical protein
VTTAKTQGGTPDTQAATSTTVSKLGPGKLTLGATPQDFSWQVVNCRLEPTHEEAEQRGTLAQPKRAATITSKWVLAGTAIQDFEIPNGFQNYCQDNNGVSVPYSFVPNTVAAKKYTGTVQIRSVLIGGDISDELTVDFSFPTNEEPLRGVTP